VKIQASAATGAINITATTGAPFASLVGTLHADPERPRLASVKAWEPARCRCRPTQRRVDSRVYMCTTAGGTTGSVRPTHTEGKRFDGDPGVLWVFLHAGFGVVRIDGFVDPAHMTGTVIIECPSEVVAPKFTGRFALQAWNSNDGYPTGSASSASAWPGRAARSSGSRSRATS
jgi:hypothetical protein